jgi:tetratricopeptide (TPR) repeat protein
MPKQDQQSLQAKSSINTGKPQLNLRVLLISALVLLIVVPLALVVNSWQVARSAPLFLQQADKFEAEENYQKAAKQIENYLLLYPHDSAAHIRLARLLLKDASTYRKREKAIEAYYRALGESGGEENLDLHRELCGLLLDNFKYLEAFQETRYVLDRDSGDPAMLRIHALAEWRLFESGALGRQKQGETRVIDSLQAAFTSHPNDLELAGLLAHALRNVDLTREEHPELTTADLMQRAEDTLALVLKKRNNDVPSLLLRYEYRARWNAPNAKDDLKEAYRLAPDDRNVLWTIATDARRDAERAFKAQGVAPNTAVEEAKNHLQRAVKSYRLLLEKHPDEQDPLPFLALGETLQQLDEKSASLEVFQAGLKKHPQQGDLFRAYMANVMLELEQVAEVAPVLETIDADIAAMSNDVPEQQRLTVHRDQSLRRGIFHMLRREARLSIPFLQKAAVYQEQMGGDSKESIRAWMLLGYAYSSMGEWGESAASFDRAAAQHPNLLEARLAGSASWLGANRPDTAVERAEQALRLNESCRTYFSLALAIFQQQSSVSPEQRVWQRFEQMVAHAREKLDDKTMEDPWRVELLYIDFLFAKTNNTAASETKPEAAIALLNTLEQRYPNDAELWRLLPSIYERMGLHDESDRCCAAMLKNEATKTDAPLVKAKVLALRQDFNGAEKLLLATMSEAEANRLPVLQKELVNVRIARRDLVGAREILEPILKQSPLDLPLLRLMADIDLALNDFNSLARWMQQMQAGGGVGVHIAHYFQIMQLIKQAKNPDDPQLVEALAEQEKLVASRPTWTEAVALKGVIEQRRGRTESAIQAYEQAIAMGEQRVTIFEQLIALLESTNRSGDAEKYLARLKSHIPFSHELTVFESSVEIRRNQPNLAVEVARRGVENRPRDAAAHLWLGRVLLLKREFAEGEKELKTAVDLAPDDVRMWNGLFAYYTSTGQHDKSRETLQQLQEKAKLTAVERSFVLAQGFEMLGDTAEALKHYQAAVATDPNNVNVLLRQASFLLRTDAEAAEVTLRKVLKIDANSALARRTLASILAARGREQDWQEAERLLATSRTNDAAYVPDNRLQAILLAQRGGTENLGRAIKIMEELTNRVEFIVDSDRLMLAQLYERQSKLSTEPETAQQLLKTARERYVDLCARANPLPAHMIAFVDFLVRHDEADEADRWLKTFETNFLNNPNANPAWIADYVRLRMARHEDQVAEKWMLALERSEPDHWMTIQLRSQLMARTGKKSEVGAYLEQKTKASLESSKNDPQRLAIYQAAGNVLASLGEMSTAEKWFRKLEGELPEAAEPLIGVLASQGKLAEAIAICQKSSDKPYFPQAVLALTQALLVAKPSATESAPAEQLINEALKRYPQDVKLAYGVASWRIVLGNTEEAIRLFKRVVELNPRHVYALNNLAMMLAERPGERKEALKYIDQAINIAGSDPALYDTKGTILLFDGQAEKAAEFLKMAVDSPVRDPRFRFHLALAYQKLRDLETAKIELEKSLKQQLEKQVLTPLEQTMLAEMRSELKL